jgi:hypothetical protein
MRPLLWLMVFTPFVAIGACSFFAPSDQELFRNKATGGSGGAAETTSQPTGGSHNFPPR